MIELEKDQKLNLYRAFLGFLVVLVLFFFVKFLSEVKTYGAMKDGNLSSIVVEGKGEVQAVPDIATVTFSIRKEGKTVKEAQDEVSKVEKLALDSLKTNNVADKDVKTSNASFYPKYEYKYDYPKLAPCTIEYGCPPQNGKNVIVGYEASESITVKVRNVDTVGKVMQDLGTVGVSDLNGPNFAIDDEETLKTEARAKAIDDAKSKAEVLAKDLGVRLVRIVSFNESGSYYPMPMYASGAMMKDAVAESAPAQVPKGENTITSNVTITYEIR